MPEVRRLLVGLSQSADSFGSCLAWSHWRRHHQAVAQRCHTARRSRRHSVHAGERPAGLAKTLARELTDPEWAKIAPLLPAQKPPVGRPSRDHRQIVCAILWLQRKGRPWTELPHDFGPWHTAYNRYQRWRRSGLWRRILETLDRSPDGSHGSVNNSQGTSP